MASGALFFLFKPTSATPGDLVDVRLAGTPASFTASRRVRPFQRPIRLYLVPNRIADDTHTRFDSRLSFVGQLVPDKNGRGIVTFRVPPLDTDDYALAAWCPGCAGHSLGRTFFTLPVGDEVPSRYRDRMLLRVTMPSATDSCPVTIPSGGKPPPSSAAGPEWYGNGLLWTRLAVDGVFTATPDTGWPGDPKGSIGTKLYWFARIGGTLTLEGRRLDASSPPLVVHGVNRGQSNSWNGPSWATAVSFPTEGCWRLKARLDDVSLSFVVEVGRG